MKKTVFALAVAALLAGAAAVHAKKKPAVRKFTSVNIQYKKTKVWVPATFFVKKGDTVEITLINETPSGKHGFRIPAYGVETTVYNGKKEVVKFMADKAGIFKIDCQHHSAHIGGQLLVLK